VPRRLPSLNGVKAFEAAARHESFTRAAEELCVTQAAVSHQVKALEAELGDYRPHAAAADLLS
jgi:LysR family glycine cleavage system transcriptional activator